jgi:hypothetical protein
MHSLQDRLSHCIESPLRSVHQRAALEHDQLARNCNAGSAAGKHPTQHVQHGMWGVHCIRNQRCCAMHCVLPQPMHKLVHLGSVMMRATCNQRQEDDSSLAARPQGTMLPAACVW